MAPQKQRVKKKAKVTLPRGIRQRPNGRFMVDVTVAGVRRTVIVDTVEEALAARSRMTAEAKGEPVPIGQMVSHSQAWTLQDAFDRTLTNVWSGLSSEKVNRINGNSAIVFFGATCPITSITTDEIDRYVVSLMDGGSSDATINRKLSALSRILRTAHERGQIPAIPKMPRRKERQGRIRFLSPIEETKVLKLFLHIGKPDHWDATVILIDTGFRTGELWRVTAEHVDMGRGKYGTITLWRTKNNKARTIPMTHRVMEVVERRAREYPEGPLFPEGSKQWYRQGWDRVRLLMNKDSDPEFVPHALRHTCCSRLVQRGVPITHVQRWMGHNTIQTTMRYAHLMPHDLFAAVDVLEGGENARWDTAEGTICNLSTRKKSLLQ